MWIYGDPGCGKSKWVWDHFADHMYVKGLNKWWDDYENQPIAFIDEFSKSKNVLADHLKIWADRYPFRAETKGSSRVIRPKVIIICSNYSIEQVFDEPED